MTKALPSLSLDTLDVTAKLLQRCMIHYQFIRQLKLAALPESPGALRHLSAASGMVVAGNYLYVIADDELHLGMFLVEGHGDGQLIRLFPGDLPDTSEARKAAKPDLEALVRLPPFERCPHGALLALASGSRPNRRTGVVLALDADSRLVGTPFPLDSSPFYLPLETSLPALNIEGAVVLGTELVLLQRASRMHPQNALVYLSLDEVLRAMSSTDSAASEPARVHIVDLGTIEGVPLRFTDGAALPDGRIVFSAVAENAEDTYLDGPCIGTAIGIIGTDGQVEALHRLEPTQKVEGVHATIHDDLIHLLMVTDADDAGVAGRLLSAEIPSHPTTLVG
jgi:hypothetical protein